MTFRDSEPIEQASSISFPSFTYFPRPSKDDIYSFSNTNIAPAPGPHVLPTTVLFPAPFDNTEIPMNTLARNTNSAYRLSNPNNPYVNSGLSKSKSRQSNLGHKSYGYVNDIFEANPLTAWAQVKDHNLVVNGLPTLEQILSRKTRHPLALSNFDEFLQQLGADQNLAFWREIYNHHKLWAALQSNIERRKRRSETESERSSNGARQTSYNSKTSASTDTSTIVSSGPLSHLNFSIPQPSRTDATEIDNMNSYLQPSTSDHADLVLPQYREVPDTLRLMEGVNSIYIPESLYSWKKVETPNMLSYQDLQQNAKRIFFKFCTPYKAETKIYLPDDYRLALQELIEVHQLADPIIFDSAFQYIYEVLNIFYYGRFLNTVMYKNLSLFGSKICLVLSILLLTIGFTMEIAFILTGFGTRLTRLWGLLPIFTGYCALIANVSEFAWWLGMLKVRTEIPLKLGQGYPTNTLETILDVPVQMRQLAIVDLIFLMKAIPVHYCSLSVA
ncbi:unnamed protein product [Umbelopsis sp. WA50703]